MFAHIKNGIRTVVVCENTQAYLMHRNHTYDSPIGAQALATGLKFSVGTISGLPLEY